MTRFLQSLFQASTARPQQPLRDRHVPGRALDRDGVCMCGRPVRQHFTATNHFRSCVGQEAASRHGA